MECAQCEQLKQELEYVQEQLRAREREVLELEKLLEAEREKRRQAWSSVDEALNIGDGSYKP